MWGCVTTEGEPDPPTADPQREISRRNGLEEGEK